MKRFTYSWITASALILALVGTAMPSVSHAQTTVDSYQPGSVQEMIAYLYGIIAQLQAQLDAQTNGASLPQVSNEVRAVTGGVSSLSGRSVEFSGTVTFTERATVRVWFEYGTTRSLINSTPILRVTGRAGTTDRVDADITGLQANRTYYYRLVVEDSAGDIAEGAIRSFTTGRTGYDYDYDYDNDYDDDDDAYYGYSLSSDSRSYDRGDTINVAFRQSSNTLHSRNYVGLYKVGACDTCYYAWRYTGDKTSGDITFRTPPTTGDYELRLYIREDDRFERVATSRTIRID